MIVIPTPTQSIAEKSIDRWRVKLRRDGSALPLRRRLFVAPSIKNRKQRILASCCSYEFRAMGRILSL